MLLSGGIATVILRVLPARAIAVYGRTLRLLTWTSVTASRSTRDPGGRED